MRSDTPCAHRKQPDGDGFRCRGQETEFVPRHPVLSLAHVIDCDRWLRDTPEDIQMSKAEEQGHRRPVVHRSERPGLPACECAYFVPHELCGTRFFLMPDTAIHLLSHKSEPNPKNQASTPATGITPRSCCRFPEPCPFFVAPNLRISKIGSSWLGRRFEGLGHRSERPARRGDRAEIPADSRPRAANRSGKSAGTCGAATSGEPVGSVA